jgi:hypothetical protein
MTSHSAGKGNLGPVERRKRFVFGLVALAGAVGLTITDWVNGLTGWVILFFLVLGGALGLLETKGKT